MAGPFGLIAYLEDERHFEFKKGDRKTFKKIGMLAGGTGITPMIQMIRSLLTNPGDTTQIWLICTDKREEDVIFR